MYYVYRHIRLDKNEPFYIGRGTFQKKRKYQRALSSYKRNKIWNDIVSKSYYKVEIIFESSNFTEVCNKEAYFVSLYGKIHNKTGILSNLTDGGETEKGFPCAEETRMKISEGNKGKTHSEYSKLKMSKSRKGLKKSEEHKIKIGLKQKGELNHQAKLVLDTQTGIFYGSLIDSYKAYNFPFCLKSLGKRLNNKIKNNTSLMYV